MEVKIKLLFLVDNRCSCPTVEQVGLYEVFC